VQRFFKEQVEEVASVLYILEDFEGCMPEDVSSCKYLGTIQSNLHHPYFFLLPLTQLLDPMTLIG
jgi:hypothetical protein